jgi:hypothetical protein
LRHNRSGHLFQNRYKSILCEEDTYLLELVRYIHLNPVRAGLVKTISELDRYPWTGHKILVGKGACTGQNTRDVLERFSTQASTGAQGYREFITDGWKMGRRKELTGGGLRRSAGGWKGVYELKRSGTAWQGDERILGSGEFVSTVLKAGEEELHESEKFRKSGLTLEKILLRASKEAGVAVEDLRKKGRNNAIARAKSLAVYWAVRKLGISGQELSKRLGVSPQAVSKLAQKGQHFPEAKSVKLIS